MLLTLILLQFPSRWFTTTAETIVIDLNQFSFAEHSDYIFLGYILPCQCFHLLHCVAVILVIVTNSTLPCH